MRSRVLHTISDLPEIVITPTHHRTILEARTRVMHAAGDLCAADEALHGHRHALEHARGRAAHRAERVVSPALDIIRVEERASEAAAFADLRRERWRELNGGRLRRGVSATLHRSVAQYARAPTLESGAPVVTSGLTESRPLTSVVPPSVPPSTPPSTSGSVLGSQLFDESHLIVAPLQTPPTHVSSGAQGLPTHDPSRAIGRVSGVCAM